MVAFFIILLASFLFEPTIGWTKKPNPTACYDFNSPVNVGGGTPIKFNFHFKKKHKKRKHSPSYSDCMKEVMKNRDEIKKDLEEIDKKIEKIVESKLKKANKIVHDTDNKYDQVWDHNKRVYKRESKYKDRRNNKHYRQRIRRDHAWSTFCLWFTLPKNSKRCKTNIRKWEFLSKIAEARLDNMRDRTNNRVERFDKKQEKLNNKLEKIESSELPYEEKKLDDLLGSLHDDMVDEFLSQDPENAEMEKDILLEDLYKNPKYNSFAKDYLKKHLPELEELLVQKEVTEERILGLKDLADEMCNTEQVACPVAKDNFENFPSIDTFKEMIATVGTIYYTDKNMGASYSQNLNVQNYDKIMDKHARYITNDNSKARMKQNFERAQEAVADLEWNMNPKNKNKEGYPKRISSACGSCDDLEELYDKIKISGSYDKFKELKNIFEQVGCPAPNVVKNSCADEANTILNKSIYTKSGNSNNPSTIEKSIDKYLELQTLKEGPEKIEKVQTTRDELIKSMNDIGLLVEETENNEIRPCSSCDIIKTRMEALSDVVQETIIEKDVVQTDEEGELLLNNGGLDFANVAKTVKYRIPKKDATKKQIDELQMLKDVAIKLKSDDCLEEEYRIEKPKNKCEEKTVGLKGFIEKHNSIEDLNLEEQKEFNNLKNNYEDFIADQALKTEQVDFNCCDEVIGNLDNDIIKNVDKGADIPSFLSRDSAKIQMAEALSCLKCGGDKNKDIEETGIESTNPHVSCKFYKENIEGKDDLSHIEGLLNKKDKTLYSVADFKKNEVYDCKEGPNKSLINRARDWETIAYSSEGKYGDFASLNMQCFIDPSGETVNLTCCDLKHDDQIYLDFKKALQDNISTLNAKANGQPSPGGGRESLSKWLKREQSKGEFENSPETFCRDVWAKGYAKESSASTSGFAVCEYKGRSYWKVDPFKIRRSSNGSMDVESRTVND